MTLSLQQFQPRFAAAVKVLRNIGMEAARVNHGSRGLNRRGSVAVEFALACTPLMILVFGFIATSAVFTTMTSMQANAQYAARMMSTGQITSNNTGPLSAANTTATTT